MNKNIVSLRAQVDRWDKIILNSINRRAKIAQQIGNLKSKLVTSTVDYFVPAREKRILSIITKLNRGPLPNTAVRNIFTEILHSCRTLQKRLSIAYLGPEITFTHLAALRTFGNKVNYVPVNSISEVFREVEKGYVDYGVVPIENSTEGVVNHTLDMFIESDLKICAETMLEITQSLLAPQSDIHRIKTVYSHPHALAQCREWLSDHLQDVKYVETTSTAQAAQLAKSANTAAAVAAEQAARWYKLNVLATHIEDAKDNFTRFLVICKNYTQPSDNDITSILFSVKDRIGALHDMLVPFKQNKINLTKIESRPSRRKPWEYIFFVDFKGHINNARVAKAVKELEHQCTILKVLGSYPRMD